MKPHDYVWWPRVDRYGLKSFPFIFWNAAGVPHDGLLGKSLVKTPDVCDHNLAMVAGKQRSQYDNTVKSCGPLLLQDNTHKSTINRMNNYFLKFNFDIFYSLPHGSDMASSNFYLFRSPHHFLVEILFSDPESLRTCLSHCLALHNCGLILFPYAQLKQRQILFT